MCVSLRVWKPEKKQTQPHHTHLPRIFLNSFKKFITLFSACHKNFGSGCLINAWLTGRRKDDPKRKTNKENKPKPLLSVRHTPPQNFSKFTYKIHHPMIYVLSKTWALLLSWISRERPRERWPSSNRKQTENKQKKKNFFSTFFVTRRPSHTSPEFF